MSMECSFNQGLHLTKLIFIHKANYERELTFASQKGNVFVGYGGCDPEQCITNSLRNLPRCLSGFTEYVFASQQLSLAKPLCPKCRMKKIAESKACNIPIDVSHEKQLC